MERPYILWADDDKDDLSLINEVLEELNLPINIKEVNNGIEALNSLHEARQTGNFPCLIILDINMPVLGGKETLCLIKATEDFKDIPVVVFSTSSSEMDKLYFRRFQVEMLTKPPQYKSLIEVVQQLITFCN
jgi:CheY-like chemotaxis protein